MREYIEIRSPKASISIQTDELNYYGRDNFYYVSWDMSDILYYFCPIESLNMRLYLAKKDAFSKYDNREYSL